MKRSTLSALALMCAMASVHAQNLVPGRPHSPHRGAARRRSGDLGHAARQYRRDAAGVLPGRRGEVQRHLLLLEAAGLEVPSHDPNASTNYVYFNYNLKNGPVVVEIPAAVGAGSLGSMVDAWDEPMNDIGPAGEDRGQGGKYLLLPPDFKGDPPPGFFAIRYPTYNGYALYRAIRNGTTDADAAAALDLVKKLRVYPLAQSANPPEQRFIDIYGKTFDGITNFTSAFSSASTA
jgi:hypothetical protein